MTTTCLLQINSKDFNDNSMEELYDYYNSLTTSDQKNTFNECLLNYKVDTSRNDLVNDTEEKLNEFKNMLEKTNNANAINDNTLSLYNDDFFYILFKSSLFIILGIVYVVFIKNTNVSNVFSTIENLKTKTIKISENIKGLTTTNPLKTTITKPPQIQQPLV